ncbi:reverse transcriptase domain-containing protein [Nocardia sp. NBC_00565]|uniref:reverse transcriptase domain-containing protein n=1 Tax=Nocardia sp. NBC_00565 TaxID=2975993 RepID=UPI002E81136C|nr:reverse transcriptase domain-containing protein [Nocardia sp. NBC_00565]WUC04152.1 reverse transcriptase domain-containing protein [Nocardia sp. NBC_00565]
MLGVLRDRGSKGLPLDELYRQLFNPQLYLVAYGRIYANKGAMTPGATAETVDGMSLNRIHRIIDAVRHERYRFSPARRVWIPKRNGKLRPLGLPTWSDKVLGEVVRLLLEAYYEPRFSDRSHGFRPGRGCHTALGEVDDTWTGTTWFVEGDVADCFGSLDHDVMIEILAEKIHDNRFLRLMRNMLNAGYLEDWTWNATVSGAPQGGVVSPILCNIYLHRLDTYVENTLIPEYTRGTRRIRNAEYERIRHRLARARRRGDRDMVRQWRARLARLPSVDCRDPGYRRLRYIRYADDVLLGFAGPKTEAEDIKQRLTRFMRNDLRLDLSQEKTLITHARTRAARFLGYEITTQTGTGGRRTAEGAIRLRVPIPVIKTSCAPYLRGGKPTAQRTLQNFDDYSIVAAFGGIYRGLVNYYLLAADVHRLERLHWVIQTSLLKTLAGKHKSSVTKMAARHRATITTPRGLRTCMEATRHRPNSSRPLVARFGGIPLTRRKTAILTDRVHTRNPLTRKEIITRLLRGTCELCGHHGEMQVHHVAKLADLAPTGPDQPAWDTIMARKRRKTLVVCPPCHDTIHPGQPRTTTE